MHKISMHKDKPEAKYHFVNKAGRRFADQGRGHYPEHQITLRIKDGGEWEEVKIAPGERYDHPVKEGVTEIEIESDVTGWPKYKLNPATPNPTKHLFVYIAESPRDFRFDVEYA